MSSDDEPRDSGDLHGASPYDTPASSGSRFLIELVAWVAGPWAAAEITGSGWAVLPTLLVLFALPAVFNTPGDKSTTGVATPGPARIVIEMLLLTAAVAGAWIAWPPWAATAVSITGLAMLATGVRRYRWLAAGAPPVPGPDPRL